MNLQGPFMYPAPPPPVKLLFRSSKTAYLNFALEMYSSCYCGATNNNLEVKFGMMVLKSMLQHSLRQVAHGKSKMETIFQDGRQINF